MSRPSHAFKDERCSVWAFCEAEVLMLKRRLRERQRKVGFWSSKATCQTCQSCQFSQCRNGSASFSNGILQGAESRDLDHPWPTWALTVTVHCNKLQDVTRSCDAPTWRQQLVHGHICAQERGNAAAALLLPLQPGRLRHILVSPPACQAVSKAGEWSLGLAVSGIFQLLANKLAANGSSCQGQKSVGPSLSRPQRGRLPLAAGKKASVYHRQFQANRTSNGHEVT